MSARQQRFIEAARPLGLSKKQALALRAKVVERALRVRLGLAPARGTDKHVHGLVTQAVRA